MFALAALQLLQHLQLLQPCQLLAQAELGRAVDQTTHEFAITLLFPHLPAEKAQEDGAARDSRGPASCQESWPWRNTGAFCCRARGEPLPKCF